MEDFYSHYTNVEAFKEIISNNSIRMTRSDFLNDPTDCRLFITLVDQYIKKHPEIFQYAISFVANKNKNEVEKVYKNGCDVVNYMEHIHKCVPLYVMSLTQTHDDMNMWNCYGQGGMELKFSIDELIKSLKETFTYDYDKQFLTEAPVIYADNKSKVEQIKVPPFKDFTLMNKGSDNVFEDHRKTMNASSSRYGTQLYDTTELNIFIESYVRSHVETLEYLLENEKISEDMSAVQVFFGSF